MILNVIYVRNFLSLNMLVHKSVCVGGEVLGCGEVSEYVLLIHNRVVTELESLFGFGRFSILILIFWKEDLFL